MTNSDTSNPHPTVLSEELAHRVLARAVELDVLERSGTTVERLREVAHELGISDAVLEEALADVRRSVPAKPSGFLKPWIDRFRGIGRSRSLLEAVVKHSAAFVIFLVLLNLLSASTRGFAFDWEVDNALRIGVNIVGVLVARHLRARQVTFVLATTAIAQIAEYAIHLVYGISSVQGGPTHFAVLLSAAIGVSVSMFARNARPSTIPVVIPSKESSPDPERSGWSLMRATHIHRTPRPSAAS